MPIDRTRANVTIELGRRIRVLRQAQGMSQERLAEKAGVHRTYVGSLERGERNVALINIVRLADALGVDPADLIKGMTNPA
jgi:transcriptional regulator with XRE-family HTH domain